MAAGLMAIVELLASVMREMVEAIVDIMEVIWAISPWSVARMVEEEDSCRWRAATESAWWWLKWRLMLWSSSGSHVYVSSSLVSCSVVATVERPERSRELERERILVGMVGSEEREGFYDQIQ
jgi:hypothetical protein